MRACCKQSTRREALQWRLGWELLLKRWKRCCGPGQCTFLYGDSTPVLRHILAMHWTSRAASQHTCVPLTVFESCTTLS